MRRIYPQTEPLTRFILASPLCVSKRLENFSGPFPKALGGMKGSTLRTLTAQVPHEECEADQS